MKYRHFLLLLAAVATTSINAATPERVGATSVPDHFVKNYDIVPMLLVTHEAGGDALAKWPIDTALQVEPFESVMKETHWGMVEGSTYYFLPSFDIYATAQLVPPAPPESDPLAAVKAAANGFMLIQFVTPNCRSCEALTQQLSRWTEAHVDKPLRWVQVDLSSSHLRGCWNGYRFTTKPTKSGKTECLK